MTVLVQMAASADGYHRGAIVSIDAHRAEYYLGRGLAVLADPPPIEFTEPVPDVGVDEPLPEGIDDVPPEPDPAPAPPPEDPGPPEFLPEEPAPAPTGVTKKGRTKAAAEES